MAGILYGVGVGPGEPELLTLKAVRKIRECDIIGIPSKTADSCMAYQIAYQAVPEMADKPILTVSIPMTMERAELIQAYEEGSRRLTERLQEGKSIAFLNLGDPTVYGTYMGLQKRVEQAGYGTEIISGVPSFCAVAAALQVPLGERQEMIHILPGIYCQEDMEMEGTRVVMKSAGKIGEIKQKLLELEATGKTEVYAVTDCGMESQCIYRDIDELSEDTGYFTTIILKDV